MDQDEKNITPPNQLRNFRDEAGLNQSDAAFLLGIKNTGRISDWEQGITNPSINHLFALSLIYQRLPDQIYYQLRKKISKKIEARKKLLREKKEKRKRLDGGG